MKLHVILLFVITSIAGVVSTVQAEDGVIEPIVARVKLPPNAERYPRSQLQIIANKIHDTTVRQTNRTVEVVELLSQSGSVIAKFTF